MVYTLLVYSVLFDRVVTSLKSELLVYLCFVPMLVSNVMLNLRLFTKTLITFVIKSL